MTDIQWLKLLLKKDEVLKNRISNLYAINLLDQHENPKKLFSCDQEKVLAFRKMRALLAKPILDLASRTILKH
jgi:hypothetical protein